MYVYEDVMQKLKSNFLFTDNDLKHNQEGKFSIRQLKTIQDKRNGYFMLFVLGIIGAFIGIFIFALNTTTQKLIPLIIITASGIVALKMLYEMFALGRDIQNLRIQTTSGRMIVKKIDTSSVNSQYANRNTNFVYQFSIMGYSEEITEDIYKRLLPYNGLEMCAYYTPTARKLLSINYLGGQTLKEDAVESQIIHRKRKEYDADFE
jgi:uncharacterized membrane protein YeaQ/YmgE (transglycosylase-associated protein family)